MQQVVLLTINSGLLEASDGTSSGLSSGLSSSTARFYKGSLKVPKAWAQLDRKIAKLEKARAQNVWNELDFRPKSIK